MKSVASKVNLWLFSSRSMADGLEKAPCSLSFADSVLPAVPSEMEDDLVFHEFKRTYLKGIVGVADDDDEEGNVSGGDDMGPKEK